MYDEQAFRERVVAALIAMERSVESASKSAQWNYDVAQRLIPGRDALWRLGAEVVGSDEVWLAKLKEG